MQLSDFDYRLPEGLIAQRPTEPRDHARLMVIERATGAVAHRQFRDLPEYLSPGDCMVINDTRVVPARLLGTREKTSGKWEGLFLREAGPGLWEMMTRTGGHPASGETIRCGELALRLVERTPASTWIVEPLTGESTWALLGRHGIAPIPPYIRAGHADRLDNDRYQTVYAANPGAVAAPTAGLHFTPELLQRIRDQGVFIETVTLHVGPGTFQPVQVENICEHVMSAERGVVTAGVADRINAVRAKGRRVLAIGTTTTRILEAAAQATGIVAPFDGQTRLFITPGYTFRAIDRLVTNFHLPKSTLLLLVSAFASRRQILDCYQLAVELGYRFYSYGDATLIL